MEKLGSCSGFLLASCSRSVKLKKDVRSYADFPHIVFSLLIGPKGLGYGHCPARELRSPKADTQRSADVQLPSGVVAPRSAEAHRNRVRADGASRRTLRKGGGLVGPRGLGAAALETGRMGSRVGGSLGTRAWGRNMARVGSGSGSLGGGDEEFAADRFSAAGRSLWGFWVTMVWE